MRLLHTTALRFAEFNDGDTPPYAVLSHRWKDGELSHDDFLHGRRKDSQGHHKVVEACRLAKSRSRDYIWIDSICIDKKSSAELSEAINAMFAWYKAAVECYAYLSDVNWTNSNVANSRDSGQSGHSGSSEVDLLGKSRWFTRGWTLQELLAPKQVLFYDSNWHFMGTKVGLAPMLSQVTGIDIEVLRHPERQRSPTNELGITTTDDTK
ncbi:hypothetical protein PRZ48_003434 [Zasmidium cellare]|uniref:Heterokaryon incompatibility domain-containing protein n=1 Tax=Zasmidium cellare TaxID=395010 RepID=A0ABR0EV24_ZASCE|nr:hypothetical protein PRZ48_003434 [Zasmidium cellare]